MNYYNCGYPVYSNIDLLPNRELTLEDIQLTTV